MERELELPPDTVWLLSTDTPDMYERDVVTLDPEDLFDPLMGQTVRLLPCSCLTHCLNAPTVLVRRGWRLLSN